MIDNATVAVDRLQEERIEVYVAEEVDHIDFESAGEGVE